ncbi:MAG: type II toxin-antitoxin system RelE/ParE family toxin [Proteobacteria bacterium]|nr:type II toxin-antitoxin system RelE/ParE family toxin [Pseudomonadota bacterium]
MTPSVSPDADRELSASSIFYAREANAEVGLAFILEYERALALLCSNPNLGALWRNRRRFALRKFPYSIIYYLRGDELRVVALAHHRRRPGYWGGRM